jgi:hypothetical protein
MKKKYSCTLFMMMIMMSHLNISAQNKPAAKEQLTPIMGWSSWNNFKINISENLIKSQATAMVSSGMKAAGYQFVNIDDGYFGGRDANGNMLSHPKRFPSGMQQLAAFIHKQGLKAGIYSDAGMNTCGSFYNKDTIGAGSGLFGHERQDLAQLLNNWGYDFIKVDWCGGEKLELDEETAYSYIGKTVYSLKPNAVYNICRWKFPGKWVVGTADSWRVSGDISNNFKSVMAIVDLNADLWRYAGPGHVNDMDMLQVGRGMSYDEDKTHFSMWCMLASPLLAGNDLTKMSKQTIDILTNRDMIAIDQDPLVYQARRINDYGDQEVWARPLKTTMSGQVAVALLNRSNVKTDIKFSLDSVGLKVTKGYTMKDVWANKTYPVSDQPGQSFPVKPHGIVVLMISGTSKPYNIFQSK